MFYLHKSYINTYIIHGETIFKGLWAVVNNAGYSTFGEMEWVPMSTYELVRKQLLKDYIIEIVIFQ